MEPGIRGNGAHAIRHDAGQFGRLVHAMVHLVRRVQHTTAYIDAQILLTRAQDGIERGHRTAGGEHAPRADRKSHPFAQPVQRVRFQLHQRRCGLPDTRVPVRRSGDEIRQRRRKQTATRDVREIARRRRVERLWDVGREQIVQQRRQRGARCRRRLAHALAQRFRAMHAIQRLVRQRGDVLHAARDDLIGHVAHCMRSEFEIEMNGGLRCLSLRC